MGAIAKEGGRLLLVKRGHPPDAGLWSVPGGRVQAGETLAEAVVRESAEETGLDVMCGDLVGWVERIVAPHHFVILDFAVTVLGVGDPVAGDDAADVAWVDLHELPGIPLVEGLGRFLTDHGVLGPLLP